MHLQRQWWSGLVAVVLGGLVGVTAVAAGEQFLPVLGAREGGQRFVAIPRADGFIAYLTLLNARDGGINGVHLLWEDCDTVYDVDRGVECYERLKVKGPTGAAVFHPSGTYIVYALTERATHDRIPLITMGFGRTDASAGWVFPYIFTPRSTTGVRTRPRSGSLPNGPAAWSSSRAGKLSMCTTTPTIARKLSPFSTPRPPGTALRCNSRGLIRRRPGGG